MKGVCLHWCGSGTDSLQGKKRSRYLRGSSQLLALRGRFVLQIGDQISSFKKSFICLLLTPAPHPLPFFVLSSSSEAPNLLRPGTWEYCLMGNLQGEETLTVIRGHLPLWSWSIKSPEKTKQPLHPVGGPSEGGWGPTLE